MAEPDSPHSLPEKTIAIAGVGLIGGSIAAALKQKGFAGRILGVGRNAARLEDARSRGLIDDFSTDLAAAAKTADLIVVCTPVDRIAADVKRAADNTRKGTLLTDAGSTKARICAELSIGLPEGVTFIGSHPLAGSEQHGFEHAEADLFADRVCVITPLENTPAAAKNRLTNFWQFLGCRILEMSPAEHDRALAKTSHLPHVAAAVLASLVDASQQDLTAGGFRDTTRIAAGNPGLWTEILLANAAEVADAIDEFSSLLRAFRQALGAGDAAALQKLLEVAKTNRDGINGES